MSDKTLVERLREVNFDCSQHPDCQIANIVGVGCTSGTCDECGMDTAHALADAIEREYLPKPRLDDGEPVQVGDHFTWSSDSGDHKVSAMHVQVFWNYSMDSADAEYFEKKAKRPAPEVLDADGVPIRVGDTVWAVGQHIVKGPFNVTAVELGVVSYETEDGRHGMYFTIGDITHKEPDSLERIEADAKLDVCVYYAGRDEHKCDGCRGAYCFECKHEMTLDLLRRQREVLERGNER